MDKREREKRLKILLLLVRQKGGKNRINKILNNNLQDRNPKSLNLAGKGSKHNKKKLREVMKITPVDSGRKVHETLLNEF